MMRGRVHAHCMRTAISPLERTEQDRLYVNIGRADFGASLELLKMLGMVRRTCTSCSELANRGGLSRLESRVGNGSLTAKVIASFEASRPVVVPGGIHVRIRPYKRCTDHTAYH